ncbi:MAG: hypothetical protein KBS59_02760 [Clostridiales bacterium]|nr:hypothetical protein [Clostridiales bacterium]
MYKSSENQMFDADVFDKMKKTAHALLQSAEKEQLTQAVVLYSEKNNEYGAVIKNAVSADVSDEARLVEKLRDTRDVKICYALCMWHDGTLDMPSDAFRKMLMGLDESNRRTLLFVMTGGGVAVRSIASTIH